MDELFYPDELSQLLGVPGNGRENWEIIFAYAKKTGTILMMDDFFKGAKESEIKKITEFIENKRLITILITNDRRLSCSIIPGDEIQTMNNDETVEKI